MSIRFKNYNNDTRFGSDYHRICYFLHSINSCKMTRSNFQWGRWAWMISRPVDNEEQREKIGIWEDGPNIVGIATFEIDFGEVFIILADGYRYLIDEVRSYAEEHLSKDNKIQICIPDFDRDFKEYFLKSGYTALENKEHTAVINIRKDLGPVIPEGFQLISMADTWDFYKYNRVMWRGFDHKGEPPAENDDINFRKTMLGSPHLHWELALSIMSPDGLYASHCGIWHLPHTYYAYIEPVVTDPDFRGRGLGKAVVYEALRRAGRRGAIKGYVCSDQQFYYNLGFYPDITETWWIKNNLK